MQGIIGDIKLRINMNNEEIISGFEASKQISTKGVEYWTARTMQKLLGYDDWRNFEKVMERAAISGRSAGIDSVNHFVGFTNMIETGKGAKRQYDDFYLSRFACYLIAMNGDPAKVEVAAAQQYFAIMTRERELAQKYLNAQERVKLRDRIRVANKHLAGAAKAAGVTEYGLFQHAGYMGLYGMAVGDVKKRKGIPPNDELLDRAGRLELSANEFRINLTENALKKEGTKNELSARQTHLRIGKGVRATVQQETGKSPEDLPIEPSIKKIISTAKQKRGLPKPNSPS
jgi:DNA-damage-inducible protein D